MKVFFDSSALIKRYIAEMGADRVRELLEGTSDLGVAVICRPEVISGLSRLRREKKIDAGEYQRAKADLGADLEDASVLNLTQDVLDRAVDLLERFTLRASDALHVACAIDWSAQQFVSADGRQCDAAEACGLKVERLALGPVK